MLNVGMIAKTYGVLPSQVLAHATTYDLMILDVMNSWEDYQQKKAAGKLTVDLSEEEMMNMVKKVRGQNDSDD